MATANNRVEVDLIANDLLSPVLNRIRGLKDQMQSSFADFGANLLGDLRFAAVNAGIDAVTSSVRALNDQIQEGAKLQTSTIANASDVALGLKIAIDPAIALVEDTQMKLSQIAAELPGEVSDFTAIFRQVASAVAPLSKDPIDFQAKAIEISKRAGVLAAVQGISAEQSGSVIDRFISGTSGFMELMNNDIFQKNAVLTQQIREGLATKGIDPKNFKQASQQDRMDVLMQALKVATPDSLLKKFSGTAESIMQDIKSKLFDPLNGLFGVMRKVPSMGDRTMLDAFTTALQSLSDLITAISKAVNLGDPAKTIISFFDWFSGLFNEITAIISGSKEVDFAVISEQIYNFMGEIIDKVTSFVESIPADKIGAAIAGLLLALGNALIGLIPRFLKLVFVILDKIAAFILGAIGGVFTFFGQELRKFFMWIISPIKDPIVAFFKAVKGLFDQMNRLVPNVPSGVAKVAGGAGSVINEGLKTVIPFYGAVSGILDATKKPQDTQPLPQNQSLPQPQASLGTTPPFVAQISVAGSANDANAIASATIMQFNQAYGQFKQGSLA